MSDIDDPIKKAMQDGQFDDLPGKGKPLNLDEILSLTLHGSLPSIC